MSRAIAREQKGGNIMEDSTRAQQPHDEQARERAGEVGARSHLRSVGRRRTHATADVPPPTTSHMPDDTRAHTSQEEHESDCIDNVCTRSPRCSLIHRQTRATVAPPPVPTTTLVAADEMRAYQPHEEHENVHAGGILSKPQEQGHTRDRGCTDAMSRSKTEDCAGDSRTVGRKRAHSPHKKQGNERAGGMFGKPQRQVHARARDRTVEVFGAMIQGRAGGGSIIDETQTQRRYDALENEGAEMIVDNAPGPSNQRAAANPSIVLHPPPTTSLLTGDMRARQPDIQQESKRIGSGLARPQEYDCSVVRSRAPTTSQEAGPCDIVRPGTLAYAENAASTSLFDDDECLRSQFSIRGPRLAAVEPTSQQDRRNVATIADTLPQQYHKTPKNQRERPQKEQVMPRSSAMARYEEHRQSVESGMLAVQASSTALYGAVFGPEPVHNPALPQCSNSDSGTAPAQAAGSRRGNPGASQSRNLFRRFRHYLNGMLLHGSKRS